MTDHSGDRKPWWHLLLWPLEVLIGLLVILDELVRPLYRPVVRWFAGWHLVARLEAAIAPLPRFAILALLAVPFAIAEPLKLISLIVIARGLVVPGVALMIFAHLVSFLLVERIYRAGRDKLLTIGWFAWGIGLIAHVRDTMLAWARRTALWSLAERVRATIRSAFRRSA